MSLIQMDAQGQGALQSFVPRFFTPVSRIENEVTARLRTTTTPDTGLLLDTKRVREPAEEREKPTPQFTPPQPIPIRQGPVPTPTHKRPLCTLVETQHIHRENVLRLVVAGGVIRTAPGHRPLSALLALGIVNLGLQVLPVALERITAVGR